MFDIASFHDVFPSSESSPYDRKLQHEIEAHRKHADGVLFIDRVMQAVGIQKAKVYPPKTENALRQLHQQICESSMLSHHKFSLLYYILLDFDKLGKDALGSEKFVSLSGMPMKYQLFMKGLWHMDRQEYSRALEYVAHPSLDRDFADEIIIAFVKQASNDDFGLALSYYYGVQPNLKSTKALELLFDAMTKTNITEALLYSRSHPQHVREQLFRRWVSCILGPGQGDNPSGRARELAFMPLDASEETWFEQYLVDGEGRTLKKAKDTLLMRKIACDRFDEVARYRASGQWATVLNGIRAGSDGRAE